MKPLDPGYSIEVDQIDKAAWHESMSRFEDASFYQTWSWGSLQWGKRQISHLVLKHQGRLVAMAQLRVIGIPLLRLGVAYLNASPLWRLKREPVEFAHLRNLLRGLRDEYARKRGYFLRLVPRLSASGENEPLRKTLEDEGYSQRPQPTQTVILGLAPSLPELRRSLRKSWSRSLVSAEKLGLEIIEDDGSATCETALRIIHETKSRKQFVGGSQVLAIAAHQDLPPPLKLRIALCRHQGTPVAVLGWTTFGRTGLILINSTTAQALELKAAFVLWWRMVEYYKNNGFTSVDLAGVSEQRNPGGYFFKTGLAGRHFKEPDTFIGRFDLVTNPVSAALGRAVLAAKTARHRIAHHANRLRKWRKQRQQQPAAAPAEHEPSRPRTPSVGGSEQA